MFFLWLGWTLTFLLVCVTEELLNLKLFGFLCGFPSAKSPLPPFFYLDMDSQWFSADFFPFSILLLYVRKNNWYILWVYIFLSLFVCLFVCFYFLCIFHWTSHLVIPFILPVSVLHCLLSFFFFSPVSFCHLIWPLQYVGAECPECNSGTRWRCNKVRLEERFVRPCYC